MKTTKRGKRIALSAGLILLALVVSIGIIYRSEIRAWYEFRRDFEGLRKNEQGYPEYRHRETGVVFVALPRGTFDMGSPETEADRMDDEGPVHKVTLSPFLIAKYGAPGKAWERGKSCRAT